MKKKTKYVKHHAIVMVCVFVTLSNYVRGRRIIEISFIFITKPASAMMTGSVMAKEFVT